MTRALLALGLLLALGPRAEAGSWGKEDSGAWSKAADAAAPAAGKRLSVEDPVLIGDLALYPVVDRQATGQPDPEVIPLGEAMAERRVTIREVASGVVGELALTNRSEAPVLVMAGDVIHGGMQDRVVQRTQLVAGGRSATIRVHCVERGRWTDRFEGTFAYAGRIDPRVARIVREGGSQAATWEAVAAANRASGIDESASWLAGRSLDPAQLAAAEGALRARLGDDKRVVGMVVARGGRFVGSEVYPTPELFARDRMAVLSSHLAARAVPSDRIAARSLPSATDAAAFLEESLGE